LFANIGGVSILMDIGVNKKGHN